MIYPPLTLSRSTSHFFAMMANDNDDDDDDDLQAALALSMQQHSTTTDDEGDKNNDTNGMNGESEEASIMKRSNNTNNNSSSFTPNNHNGNENNNNTTPSATASNDNNNNSDDNEFFNCKSFHKLMWNDTSTTNNDKERWIYECISTPYFDFDVDDSSSPSQSTQSAQQLNNSYDDKFATTSSSSMMTPLEVFTSSSPQSKQHSKHKHKPIWRLTQKHGGPCGILASIQAELIRILLFGRGGTSSQKELYYPFTPSSLSNYNANNCVAAPINQLEVKEALGMSIGMILARAALFQCMLGTCQVTHGPSQECFGTNW